MPEKDAQKLSVETTIGSLNLWETFKFRESVYIVVRKSDDTVKKHSVEDDFDRLDIAAVGLVSGELRLFASDTRVCRCDIDRIEYTIMMKIVCMEEAEEREDCID